MYLATSIPDKVHTYIQLHNIATINEQVSTRIWMSDSWCKNSIKSTTNITEVILPRNTWIIYKNILRYIIVTNININIKKITVENKIMYSYSKYCCYWRMYIHYLLYPMIQNLRNVYTCMCNLKINYWLILSSHFITRYIIKSSNYNQ